MNSLLPVCPQKGMKTKIMDGCIYCENQKEAAVNVSSYLKKYKFVEVDAGLQ